MVLRFTQRMSISVRTSSQAGRRALASAASLAFAIGAVPVRAQEFAAFAPWRFTAEAGAAAGGVWLEGARVPRVSTGLGFTFAAGAGRAISQAAGGVAVLRVSVQPLDLEENGEAWKGGTLTQYDMLALLAVRAPSAQSLRTTVEGGIGAAVLTGASHIVPFRNTKGVAPIGEIGIAVMRAGASSGPRVVALVARYGVVRLSADGEEGGATGWVGRVSAGVRVTR